MINRLREEFITQPERMREYYDALLARIEEKKDLNIFIDFDADKVEQRLQEISQKSEKGALYGIPFTVKDNISVKNMKLTCGSKMLADFTAVYDATVIERLLKEDAVVIGKVNMDEFAMGSSSETSFFGPTKNPLDPTLVPGGSSSGSCAAVGVDIGVFSLGSDTGGSVRQPASYCNVIGYMPSYGTFSRYGVVSMANTLDQVGIVARELEDIRKVANIIGGHDHHDMMTIEKEQLNWAEKRTDNGPLKVGVFDLNLFEIEPSVKEDYERGLDVFRRLGAEIKTLSFSYLKYALPLYNVIMASEVSSNMSRFDGIRYGYATDDYDNTREMFVKTRSEGFGEEVKRRIAMGTHYLSSEDDQKIYKQGLRVRRLLQEEFQKQFEQVDVIVTPTVTNLPYPLGARVEDPMAMYDSGSFNVPVNLAGLCAISLPVRQGLSSSIQLIGNRFEDEKMLSIAQEWEAELWR